MNPGADDPAYPLGLFDAYGVELEYMIVDRQTLDVRPVADELFRRATGAELSDHQPGGPDGPITWSNELVLHVVELKTSGPAPTLDGLEADFQEHVGLVNNLLSPMGCRLMPTGMHPWMDPAREMRLWPHENNEIYRTYDRIFGCAGHGWANLQSAHVNLPFADDREFGTLHAAIRTLLPLLPALCASSPFADARAAPAADYRMEVYRTNSVRVPMMAGLVVPEPVFSASAYRSEILGVLYDRLAPLDPEGVLRHEFANARGAIARFDRGAIEIRVMDVQECPAADLALVRLVCAAVQALTEERWSDAAAQRSLETGALHAELLGCIREAEAWTVRHGPLLAALGLPDRPTPAAELWKTLADRLRPDDPTLHAILRAGTLATRMRRAAGPAPSRDALRALAAELADCLAEGTLFRA